ncbi:MAG: hypothetical protein Q7R86_02710 [bacterium]|nr:hypothetical protein [bacterium]
MRQVNMSKWNLWYLWYLASINFWGLIPLVDLLERRAETETAVKPTTCKMLKWIAASPLTLVMGVVFGLCVIAIVTIVTLFAAGLAFYLGGKLFFLPTLSTWTIPFYIPRLKVKGFRIYIIPTLTWGWMIYNVIVGIIDGIVWLGGQAVAHASAFTSPWTILITSAVIALTLLIWGIVAFVKAAKNPETPTGALVKSVREFSCREVVVH